MQTPEPNIREGVPQTAETANPSTVSPTVSKDISLPYYSSIGGPLILVSIGIVISFFLLAGQVYKIYVLINSEEWARFSSPRNPNFHPLRKPFVYGEWITAIVLLVFTVRVGAAYFWKQKVAPRWLIAYFLVALAISLVEFCFVRVIPSLREQQDKTAYQLLIVNAVICLTWIPYFLFSRRVKGTFVH